MATILLVDDHDMSHAAPAAELRRRGHRVLEAHDPDVALEYLRTAQPDLVLADVLLATPGGFPFAMRPAGAVPPQTRFVFCAPAFLMAEARALAKAHGVTHVVAKPLDPAE